jgi:23S rRNA pseudouridine955/2504/2580 synthase
MFENGVNYRDISQEQAGQRLDNYLLSFLKGVPRSHLYRLVRTGQVRVNGGRVAVSYRLKAFDRVRIPPVNYKAPSSQSPDLSRSMADTLEKAILYEDNGLIVLNKPPSLASHGGSGLSYGVIEAMRALRGPDVYIELVHRLDQGTSGCLMLAKKRSYLQSLQSQLREHQCEKFYWVLVAGDWAREQTIKEPLEKYLLPNGERRVRIARPGAGKEAKTHFKPLIRFGVATLLEAKLYTGRTHQIRVHCGYKGHFVLGDEKYSDLATEQLARSLAIGRLCLHSRYLGVSLDVNTEEAVPLRVTAPLPESFVKILSILSKKTGKSLECLENF